MASTYLTRTPSSAGNRKKFTWSAWVKRSKISYQNLTGVYTSSSNYCNFQFASDGLRVFDNGNVNVATNAVLRDPNAWYHIVFRIDTTHGTEANRVRIYINGVQQTSLSSATYPSQNFDMNYNTNTLHGIGARSDGDAKFDGSMSHVHFLDGEDRDASYFGETDATTGEWKIKTSPTGINYGTNGYFILKDGNSTADVSPNNNTFTISGGTLTKTEDCPSNVFATWNPLHKPWSGSTWYANGNTYLSNTHSSTGSSPTTLGATSGKYYFEMKRGNTDTEVYIGVCGEGFVSDDVNNKYSGATYNATTGLLNWKHNGKKTVNGTGTSSYFNSYASGDILGIALDLDASTRTVTFYKNGVAESVGSQNLPTNMQTGYVFGVALVNTNASVLLNTGNGYFGTTAVSSNSGNGYSATGSLGIFQYQPPTGYTALCTKGLNL